MSEKQTQDFPLKELPPDAPDELTYEELLELALAAQLEAEHYRELAVQDLMEKDLAQIRAHNPEEKAQSTEELGQVYAACIEQGLDPVTAYEIARGAQIREGTAPASMGAVSAEEGGDGGIYSIDELRTMTPEQVRRNWAKVQKTRKFLKL